MGTCSHTPPHLGTAARATRGTAVYTYVEKITWVQRGNPWLRPTPGHRDTAHRVCISSFYTAQPLGYIRPLETWTHTCVFTYTHTHCRQNSDTYTCAHRAGRHTHKPAHVHGHTSTKAGDKPVRHPYLASLSHSQPLWAPDHPETTETVSSAPWSLWPYLKSPKGNLSTLLPCAWPLSQLELPCQNQGAPGPS